MSDVQDDLNLDKDIQRDIVALALNEVDFFLDIYEYLNPTHLSDETAQRSWELLKLFFGQEKRLPWPPHSPR